MPEIVEPLLAVTVYPVTDDPPLLVGAVNETVTCASPLATVIPVGAFGTVDGVTADEAVDCAEVPIALLAVTLNVYGVPFVNPVISQVSVGATVVHVPAETFPDVYAVAVYPVTSEPRESSGASHETVAVVLPLTAVTFRGSEGAAFTDALVDAVDAEEVPAALVAVTVNVYAVPATNPVETSQVVAGAKTVQVNPPGEDVTVYEVIGDPLSAGLVQPTVTFPVPAVVVIPVGASGALAGVIAEVGIDTADETDEPLAVELVIALNV